MLCKNIVSAVKIIFVIIICMTCMCPPGDLIKKKLSLSLQHVQMHGNYSKTNVLSSILSYNRSIVYESDF